MRSPLVSQPFSDRHADFTCTFSPSSRIDFDDVWVSNRMAYGAFSPSHKGQETAFFFLSAF